MAVGKTHHCWCGSKWVAGTCIYHFQKSKFDRLEFRIRNEKVVFQSDPNLPTMRPLQMYSYLKWEMDIFHKGDDPHCSYESEYTACEIRVLQIELCCDRADGIQSAFPFSWSAFPFVAIDIFLMRISCPQVPSHSEISNIFQWSAPRHIIIMIHYG